MGPPGTVVPTPGAIAGFVETGGNIAAALLTENNTDTLAGKVGFELVEANFIGKIEGGVATKTKAAFAGALAAGFQTVFNWPDLSQPGKKVMSLAIRVDKNTNGEISTKVIVSDMPVSSNVDIVSRLEVELSVTKDQVKRPSARKDFVSSFIGDLDEIMSKVGGGTLAPPGGFWASEINEAIADLVADQMELVDRIDDQKLTVEDILAGQEVDLSGADLKLFDLLQGQGINIVTGP